VLFRSKANDTSNQAQTLVTVITIGLVVVGTILAVFAIFITAITIITSIFAFLGFSSLTSANEVKEKMLQGLENMRKDAAAIRKDATATHGWIVNLTLGDQLMSIGSVKEAIESYRNASTFSLQDEKINTDLGFKYSNAGYFDDAFSAFSRATQTNPNYAEAWKGLGLAYRRRGEKLNEPEDFNKAIEYLQKAITLKPDDDDGYGIMGGLYKRLGEYKRSLANYTQAHSINPDSSYALGNLASLSWYLGEIADAKKYFTDTEKVAYTRISKGTPEGYWDYYDLALSQLVLGKPGAMDSYKQAINITPTPGKEKFKSVLDNLKLLQKASTPIPDLPQVIQMIEDAKSKSL
jgi:tetratricopeptide (TPR) repeat protein